jgi:predicted deacetylase
VKIKVVGRTIEIDIYDLVESLPTEDQKTLADALAVRDEVCRYVAQQIIGDWTEHNSLAGRNCVADSEPRNGLDWACREVAKRAGEVAADEIKRLEAALKYREQENATLQQAMMKR